MIPNLTQAQADILTAFFKKLNQEPMSAKTASLFGTRYPETYQLPYNVTVEVQHNDIPTKMDGIVYEETVNKGLEAMLVDTKEFSNQRGNPQSLERDIDALAAYVAQQHAMIEYGRNWNIKANAFAAEIFAGFDFAGLNLEPSYETRAVGDSADGTLRGTIEFHRTHIALNVYHKEAPSHTGINLYPREGQLASALKPEVQQAWYDLVQKARKVGEITTDKMAALKKADRRMTNPEIDLLAVLFTISNLGQNAKYTIEGNKFTMVEQRTTADLTNLSNCRYIAKDALRNVMEEQEGFDAVNGEIHDWTKEFSAKKGKSTTLAGIAETWNEMIPLCHYLAVNNK
jgi:hypothetical protein